MLGFTFVKMLIVILVLLVIIVMVNRHIIIDDDIREQEAHILISSLFTHPYGPSFYDEDIGRMYPYTIDSDFFRGNPDEKMEEIFYYSTDEPHVSIKVELLSMSDDYYEHTTDIKPYDEELEPAYLHERQYNAWSGIASTEAVGPGSILEEEKLYFVNIVDNGQKNKGIIRVVVLLMRI